MLRFERRKRTAATWVVQKQFSVSLQMNQWEWMIYPGIVDVTNLNETKQNRSITESMIRGHRVNCLNMARPHCWISAAMVVLSVKGVQDKISIAEAVECKRIDQSLGADEGCSLIIHWIG